MFQFEPLSVDDIKQGHSLGMRTKSADWETKTCGSRMTHSSSWPRSAMATPTAHCGTGSRCTIDKRTTARLYTQPGRGMGKQGRGLRPHGRFPLRRGRRTDQEHARQRSGRRALYWLAQMLEAGEDVRFLSRRIVILASEDIGNADPHALPLAVAAMQATEFVGLPECQLPLAQAVTYLACAPGGTPRPSASRRQGATSNGTAVASARAFERRPLCGHERLGHGENYEYAHNAPDAVAARRLSRRRA